MGGEAVVNTPGGRDTTWREKVCEQSHQVCE